MALSSAFQAGMEKALARFLYTPPYARVYLLKCCTVGGFPQNVLESENILAVQLGSGSDPIPPSPVPI